MARSLFHGKVYSIKFVSGLQSVDGGFSMSKKTPDLSEVTDKLLSQNVVSSTPLHEWDSSSQLLVVTGTDCIGSSKSNYNTITTTTVPVDIYMIMQLC
jgi:hypothetical protein